MPGSTTTEGSNGPPLGRLGGAKTELACYREIFERLRQAVLVQSGTGETLLANAAARVLFGTSEEDGGETPVGALAGADGRPLEISELPPALALASGAAIGPIAVELHRADGNRRSLDYEAMPLRRAGRGVPDAVVSLVSDVTERRRAEDRFHLVFELGAIGMAMVDLGDARFLRANPALCAFLGRAEPDLLGRRVPDVVHPEDRKGLEARMAALQRGRFAHYRDERRYLRSDGAVVWAVVDVVLVNDQDRPVPYLLAQVQDVTDRKLAEQALAHQAMHDSLTGLANRSLLADRLERALRRARRSGRHLALLFVDLDGFKLVNDRRGHAFGDRLLVEIARRLSAGVRDSDTVARFGGDEFVVVCEGVSDRASAIALGEALVELFERPFLVESEIAGIGASCGVALCSSESVDEALRLADAAMYRAKSAGGGRAVAAGPGRRLGRARSSRTVGAGGAGGVGAGGVGAGERPVQLSG